MSDINTVSLTGRLGADIELRYTPSGKAVADVNLAVVSGWGKNEKTNWIGLTFWDKSAEAAQKHLGKGRKIAICGRLDQDEWQDKQTGQKRTKTRVVVSDWTFADSKGDSGPLEQRREAASFGEGQDSGMRGNGPENGSDDDIPF